LISIEGCVSSNSKIMNKEDKMNILYVLAIMGELKSISEKSWTSTLSKKD
jgi:hypothetical protein